jgi:cell division GTPase FtsZ
MTELHAKPIIENKFWIVEQDGEKIATLRKNEDNHFIMSNEDGVKVYPNKESLTRQFGKEFLCC